MFKRKLLALEYHHVTSFDVNDDAQFRNLIVWLEDQKIRHYKIEDREVLRCEEQDKWQAGFNKYLADLNCLIIQNKRESVLDWLLGYAVRLEYGDNVDRYKDVKAESFQQQENSTTAQPVNPIDAMDHDDPDFKAGVASLAQMLQIPPHPDHKQVLKAICTLVKNKLSKQVLSQLNKDGKVPTQITLDKMALGFDTGDYISSEAAKILRLLYIQDIRELQDEINTAIVKVQAITADPKTDTRLGKVGR